ncbi:MAG: winged helix-turn-helix domain-containing protein [Phycisphaerales bacterium]
MLASDLRCNMVIRLATQPMNVSALAARLRCAPSTASRNLRRLVEGRIVKVEQRQGKRVYRLSDNVSVQRSGDMVELHIGIPCGGEVALRLLRPIDGP